MFCQENVFKGRDALTSKRYSPDCLKPKLGPLFSLSREGNGAQQPLDIALEEGLGV